MKYKFLIPIIFSIVVGFFIGKSFFNDYDSTTSVFNEGEKLYFIKLNSVKENVSLDEFLTLNEDGNYYVYVGITKEENTARKIESYYEKLDNDISIKEKYVDNYSFLNILTEYDKICSAINDDKNLIDIERIVISNYKEMILEDGAN